MTNPMTIRTPKRRARFLEVLSEHAIVGRAAAAAGASRSAFYRWRREDPDFAADWDEAVDLGISALEDEALRRALEGEETPVFHGGKQIGVTRKLSERLLIFMLKARRPEIYGDRATAPAAERRAAQAAAEAAAAETGTPGAETAGDDDFDMRGFLHGKGLELTPLGGRLQNVDPAYVAWLPDDWMERQNAAWRSHTDEERRLAALYPRDDGRRAPPPAPPGPATPAP
ncbi:MAG TPA: hypothetical protein VKN76_03740 [Kiloniellaceae bacterium]|nr:hypothetical protein [Kiloniellaceae bacterium]